MTEFVPLSAGSASGRIAFASPTYANGRYETIRFLGRGGRGYVLLVRDTWSGGLAVLKGGWWNEAELQPHAARDEFGKRQKTVHNAILVVNEVNATMLRAPSMIDVFLEPVSPTRTATGNVLRGAHGSDRYNREPFMVQQFVGDPLTECSTNLEERLHATGPLPEMELVDFAEQMSSMLDALHTRRDQGMRDQDSDLRYYWVHTDIKPLNTLVVDHPRRYFLIDLDDARRVWVGKNPPDSLPIVATKAYSRDEPLSDRYDVLSFALSFYEAATGTNPIDLARRGGEKALRSEVTEQLANLNLHPMLIRIVLDCIPENPKRRLGTDQIRQGLAAVRNSLTRKPYISLG